MLTLPNFLIALVLLSAYILIKNRQSIPWGFWRRPAVVKVKKEKKKLSPWWLAFFLLLLGLGFYNYGLSGAERKKVVTAVTAQMPDIVTGETWRVSLENQVDSTVTAMKGNDTVIVTLPYGGCTVSADFSKRSRLGHGFGETQYIPELTGYNWGGRMFTIEIQNPLKQQMLEDGTTMELVLHKNC